MRSSTLNVYKKYHNKHDFIDMHSANMISCVYENFVGCLSVYIFMILIAYSTLAL